MPLAAGVKIAKVVASDVIVALASDGTVWSWGGGGTKENLGTNDPDYTRPHQVATTSTNTTLPSIVDVATGNGYSYALASNGDLYAWGLYGEVVGLCKTWCPAPQPVLATHLLTDGGAKAKIKSIYANYGGGSYALLTDGTLWAWGSNGQGLVGNGVEPDYAKTNPAYTWDWGKDDLLVSPAVRIAPQVNDFTAVFTSAALTFYVYAMTSDGKLYSWGRNKTADLGNGVSPLNTQQAATYPNSWDVTVPTLVSPMTAPDTPTSSPECTQNPSAGSCWCGSGPNDPQTC
jgi:alpha-tubulin suppressor-like RCC1 family protein